jgi:hypothetical protein
VVAGSKDAARLAAAPRFRLAAHLPLGFELFENPTAMPRFFVVHDAVYASSLAEAHRLIAEGAVDLHRTAITDRPIALPRRASGLAGETACATGTSAVRSDVGHTVSSAEAACVQTVDYQPGWLQLQVSTQQPALLVLAESYYPGWTAWVDGTPAEIYRTDIAFRGVSVPAGTHTVRMEFRPAIFPISIAVSAGTAVLLGLFWWGRRRLSRRRQDHRG